MAQPVPPHSGSDSATPVAMPPAPDLPPAVRASSQPNQPDIDLTSPDRDAIAAASNRDSSKASPAPDRTPRIWPDRPTGPVGSARQSTSVSDVHRTFELRFAELHAHFLEIRAEQRAQLFQSMEAIQTELASSSPSSGDAPQSGAKSPGYAVVPTKVPSATIAAAPTPAVTTRQAEPGSDPASTTQTGLDDTQIIFHPTGPRWDQTQLQIHASGKISELFGPSFEAQDNNERQCRVPQPPLLFMDRVTGVSAEIGTLGKGTMWSETEITTDSWYLNNGRIPPGVMAEAGQAHLLLISYMGIDLMQEGDRANRLLSGKITFVEDLPAAGETLQYEVRITGHAQQGDLRLYFFEFDCISDGKLVLTLRGGQAGFFTRDELAAAGGVPWHPGKLAVASDARLDPPAVSSSRAHFTSDQIEAFSCGNAYECFGPGWEYTQTHTRTPTIQSGKMLLIDEVVDFSPNGGPLGRGYLKATGLVDPQAWYFDAHFKDDPCMPGDLMFESVTQTLSFYLAALGHTIEHDAWRFQPVPGHSFELKCGAEINPDTKSVEYEVFVEEISAEPFPTIVATVLGTVDGVQALLAKSMALELVPDWPLTTRPELASRPDPKLVVRDKNGFEFGWHAMISSAIGKPSEAFGSSYTDFDRSNRKMLRLPAPPYHFMSRITESCGEFGELKPGMEIVCEYDIPEDAWYFDKDETAAMPLAVLLEAGLQPCGWLAAAIGSELALDADSPFRNLDGTVTMLSEVRRTAGVLSTRIKINKISKAASMIIEDFEVTCSVGDTVVYKLLSQSGLFPAKSLKQGAGLPISEQDRALVEQSPTRPIVDLTQRPTRFFDGPAHLPNMRLLVVDRVAYFPKGGSKGLGVVRGEKDIDANEWFFKAHFFQDPVQPGSLGLEALIQLLKFFMLENDLAADITSPHFEPLQLNQPLSWKYRGQVASNNQRVTTVMEIVETGRDDDGVYVIGNGSAWCDGVRLYEAKNMGMRITSRPPVDAVDPSTTEAPPTTTVPRTTVPESSESLARPNLLLSSSDHTADDAIDVSDSLRQLLNVSHAWLGSDLLLGLTNQYVGKVMVTNPGRFATLQNRPAIYVANHQVQIESLLLPPILGALVDQQITAMAHAKHKRGWLGQLVGALTESPRDTSPHQVVYFAQENPGSMMSIIDSLKADLAAGTTSFFVHAQGTRSRSCRERTTKLTSLFIDLALQLDLPIVPVRFVGGLPIEPITSKWDFSIGHSAQDYWFGEPIEAADLSQLPLKNRRELILDAINTLGVTPKQEIPSPVDTQFTSSVAGLAERTGLPISFAVVRQVLATFPNPSGDTRNFINALTQERPAANSPQTGTWSDPLRKLLTGPNP